MATAVGLNMKITADTAGIGRGVNKTERLLGKLSKSSASAASSLRALVGIEIGTRLASAFAVAARAAADYALNVAKSIDETAKLAQRTGIAVEALQGFQVAADLSGVQNLEGGLQRLSITLGDAAAGSATAQKAFANIGLSVDDLMAMSPEDQFRAVAAAIAAIPDPAARAAAAVDLFGRTGVQLLPLFASNLAEVEARAERLGIVLSQDQTAAIEEMNDSLSLVQKTFDGIIGQVTANLAPAVTALAEEFLAFVEGFEGANGEIGGTALADAISVAFFDGADYVASILDPWLTSLLEWAGVFESTTSQLGGWFQYFQVAVDLMQAAFYSARAIFNSLLIGLAEWGKYIAGVFSSAAAEAIQTFQEGLSVSVEQDRQRASDSFMGRNRPTPAEQPGILARGSQSARDRFEQSRTPEARAAREQERLFNRLNDNFGKANETARAVFGENVPAAVAEAAGQVEELIVSAMEDGVITEEEAKAIAEAQAKYNEELRKGKKAMDDDVAAKKKRDTELQKLDDKMLDLAVDYAKKSQEIEGDRLDALSRRSNQALSVGDIRSGGISEVLRIATGREDPAIDEYRKQLAELRKIEAKLDELRADKVKIIGGAGRAA
jgi:hypothetical protein